MNRIAAVVAGLSLAFVGTSASFADTINVPGDQPTIAAAINASVNGDVINIAAGTYYEHSLKPGGKAITIQGTLNGDGTLATTIDAQQEALVFRINSGEGAATVVRDLVITGGSATNGGGITIRNGSSPTISNCRILDNVASDSGGGIYCYNNSNPTITDCEISGNTANYGGGGIACETTSNPTISGCTISGNEANYGGGIDCDDISNPTIASTLLCANNPNQIQGNYTDDGGNTIQAVCPGVCCTNRNCVTFEQGASESECLKYFGQWLEGGDCDDCSLHLAGDLDGDGDVDTNDLSSLLSMLELCASDTDMDGDTDIEDLLNIVAGWGTTCP